MGEERARQLVAALKPIIGPVVDAAEADLRQRIGPQGTWCCSGASVRYLAATTLREGMASICVGTVYLTHSGDPVSNSIQLMRDGTVTWRRDYRGDAQARSR